MPVTSDKRSKIYVRGICKAHDELSVHSYKNREVCRKISMYSRNFGVSVFLKFPRLVLQYTYITIYVAEALR